MSWFQAALLASIHRKCLSLGEEFPGLPIFLSTALQSLHQSFDSAGFEEKPALLLPLTGPSCAACF